jgi:hypothetical protein
MVVNTMGIQDKKNHNGEMDSNNGEGIHSHTTMQSHPHLYTRTPRPTMPLFEKTGIPTKDKHLQ